MAVLATSQMTIVDLSDLPTLSVYLQSSLPATVVYDPDSNGYAPDWSTSNLVLTPVISLDSESIFSSAAGISIEWKRKYGTASEDSVVSGANGERISNGILTVSNNKFTNYQMVTYICNVTFTDPDVGTSVSAQTQMTYSLIRNAPTVRSCSIVGNNIFLYDGERNIIGDSETVLTAVLNNVEVSAWQYYNNITKAWTNYTLASSYTGTTLTVKATDSCFYNDTAKIKLLTTDSSVFDLISIIKVKDGAAGGNSIVVQLSNESHTLPADDNGNVISYNGADTLVTVYEGGDDVSSDWAITPKPGNGVTGTSSTDVSGHVKYTVTGLTNDSSYVEFVCTFPKTGAAQTTITKRFSLMKNRSGADAVIYSISCPVGAINRDKNSNYSPTSVKFTGKTRVGNNDQSDYSGIYKFYLSTDGNAFSLVKTVGTASSPVTGYTYPSSNDTQFHTSNTKYRSLKCEMYNATGSKLLDVQTIPIIDNGIDGEKGQDGAGGYSVVLGNYADTIPCNNDKTVSSAKVVNIPFKALSGISYVSCSCTVSGLPSGATVTSNTNFDASKGTEGRIQITFAKGSNLGGIDAGEIVLTCSSTIDNKTLSTSQIYSWSKSVQGSDGVNAVNFYIQPTNGRYIFDNGKENITLNAYLLDGATNVTSSGTYTWHILSGGSWVTKGTNLSYSVDPADVISVACIQCKASYAGTEYLAYITVMDKADPYNCDIQSTVGDKLVNGAGFGAVYCRVFRRDEELDPLKSNIFSISAPSNPVNGQLYYAINNTSKTVTLMKYSNSRWSACPEDYIYTYKYYARNKDGNFITSAGEVSNTAVAYATGKVFFIDNTNVDKKITFYVEVSDE